LLKSALYRGGLTNETLETLLEGESGAAATDEASYYNYNPKRTFPQSQSMSTGLSSQHHKESLPTSNHMAIGSGPPHAGSQRGVSYGQPVSSICTSTKEDDDDHEHTQRVPVHDQRTVLITSLPERTTHKDLVGIVRGGRLLDIFLRNDRTATVSFVEGAADFLAYVKRNDIYLNTKRVSTNLVVEKDSKAKQAQLERRWADRQFKVPSHVSDKIANGVTRNLVVRGVDSITAAQIRDHLDHIHNLVVVDISFRNGDAYISTNSIHNALFARTCMMSRTAYKGLRIEYFPDECAGPLPRVKVHVATPSAISKIRPITNTYAVLDTGSEAESDSESESYLTEGVRINHRNWADATAA
jgi:hypothetical protein